MKTKFPVERGMKIRLIPRGIGDVDPRDGNPVYNDAIKFSKIKITIEITIAVINRKIKETIFCHGMGCKSFELQYSFSF